MRPSRIKRIITSVAILILTFAAVPAQAYVAARAGSLSQVRQVSRRTSRRTSRRVVRRRMYAMPPAHTTVVRAGTTYYVSGGVYYVQQMEAGKVVYVEVTVNN